MSPGLFPQQFEALRQQSQGHLIDFMKSEIQLGFTFTEWAVTERDSGNKEHFEHAKHDAERALETIQRFLNRIESTEVRTVVSDRCEELQQAVAAL